MLLVGNSNIDKYIYMKWHIIVLLVGNSNINEYIYMKWHKIVSYRKIFLHLNYYLFPSIIRIIFLQN